MSNPGTTPGAPAGGPALPAKGAFPQHLVAFFARKFRGALVRVRVFLWRISGDCSLYENVQHVVGALLLGLGGASTHTPALVVSEP